MVRSKHSPWIAAALGALVYLLAAPPSADLAAQEYRADLGLTLWDDGWFAGHHVPGYSLLFPPLGGALGVRLTGALAAIAAAASLAALARRHWGARAGGASSLWLAAATMALLLDGRITFLLGVAVGAGALLALAHERRFVAVGLAAATTLASPVAGLFVALAVAGWTLAAPRPRLAAGIAIGTSALAPIVVMLVLFPEGGSEPFVASSFWPALAGALVVAALLPAGERALRVSALLYAVTLVAAFALATPLGGNATRLGALAAGPIALGALRGRRHPALVAGIAVVFAYWPLYPAVRDVVRASGDPAVQAGYHAPLLRFLRQPGDPIRARPGSFRVEIPPTADQSEAHYVAGGRSGVPLARGWERQLDRRDGALFYDGSLSTRSYRAWLDERAVAFVAVADAPLDAAARDETRLIAGGLPYLHEVWRDAHWRVYAVHDPTPLASTRGGGARAIVGRGGITLHARHAGAVLVRVHFTRWWRVTSGRACVTRTAGDMTRVELPAAGTVRLQARLTGSSCRR